MINFGGLFGGGGDDTGIIEPRRIFPTLTRDERFKRPSDEQGEVLDEWFDRRNESDLTIKMNTGSGKTLVGLLLLKSLIRALAELDSCASQKATNLNLWHKLEVCDGSRDFITCRF